MNIKTIERIAKKNGVRVSVRKEQGKRVIGLHGFLTSIQEIVQQISGYYIEKTESGYYLYSDKAIWK